MCDNEDKKVDAKKEEGLVGNRFAVLGRSAGQSNWILLSGGMYYARGAALAEAEKSAQNVSGCEYAVVEIVSVSRAKQVHTITLR